jgi:RNA-directed DNA polymerase
LIGKYLRRGAMVEGLVEASVEGTPDHRRRAMVSLVQDKLRHAVSLVASGPASPLLANIYLDALDKELDQRGHSYCRYADDCNIYVSSQAAAERTLASIRDWIEKHLRLKVNEAKSGTGRVGHRYAGTVNLSWTRLTIALCQWSERKFLGFRLTRKLQIGIAPESLERFKAKVRELLGSRQSKTSNELRDAWRSYIRGWWGYFQLAEDRQPILRLEGWIRRHIRKLFWLRWHNKRGRERKLRGLGVKGQLLKVASSARGAWRIAAAQAMQSALTNAVLRKTGFLMPSDLATKQQGC